MRGIVSRQIPRIHFPAGKMLLLLFEKTEQFGRLLACRLAGQAAPEGVDNTLLVVPPAVLQRAQRKRSRGFHEQRLIQSSKSLERRVRSRSPHTGSVAIWRVKSL